MISSFLGNLGNPDALGPSIYSCEFRKREVAAGSLMKQGKLISRDNLLRGSGELRGGRLIAFSEPRVSISEHGTSKLRTQQNQLEHELKSSSAPKALVLAFRIPKNVFPIAGLYTDSILGPTEGRAYRASWQNHKIQIPMYFHTE